MQKNRTLSMIVTNTQLLESGLSAQCVFTTQGGIIGSENNNVDWYLIDSKGQIHPRHCGVSVIDGAFCLQDLCGHTYINGSHMPLGRGSFAKLEHKDEVRIGSYLIRIILESIGESDLLAHGSLEELFENNGIELLKDADWHEMRSIDVDVQTTFVDPLIALDNLINETNEEQSLLDDLPKNAEKKEWLASNYDEGSASLQFTPQADSEYEMTSSIRLKKILGLGKKNRIENVASVDEASQQSTSFNANHSNENASEGLNMDENVLDLLEEEVAKNYQPQKEVESAQPTSVNHLLTGPMLTGLGVEVANSHDMARMHMLSEELGQSLQACVKGLLELHQQASESRFGMMNRNLQPIEDNPLRLGLSYAETIRTLYDADKSLVHLSAPAAISESLKNIRNHNEAMQHATSEALNQILNAFSPQVLLRRFEHYKRNSDKQNQTSDSWAWDMYCHYYQELTSHRQKGFEKLFWEIFEQSYDKKIREKQLEL
ncbi:type VI secretion system-associated FHA domain protein TagH [Vibrio injensis]|uniref:type VI secretion system-associated FHA domain protein TagH n=1 Tax=Vibrio injensis TaxID=1307414 RepID=UPI0009325F5C|nr:type VI secretion system-associated FHA domain protein TagH [Vibrio injensis]